MRGHYNHEYFGKHMGDHFGCCSPRYGFPDFGFRRPWYHHGHHGSPGHKGPHGPPHGPYNFSTDCGPARGYHGESGCDMICELHLQMDGPRPNPRTRGPHSRPGRDHSPEHHGHIPYGSHQNPEHEHRPPKFHKEEEENGRLDFCRFHRLGRQNYSPDRHRRGPRGRHGYRFDHSPDVGFGYETANCLSPSRCHGSHPRCGPHGHRQFRPEPPRIGRQGPFGRPHRSNRRCDWECRNERCCSRNEESENEERNVNRPNNAKDKDQNVTGDTVLVQRIVVERGSRPKSI